MKCIRGRTLALFLWVYSFTPMTTFATEEIAAAAYEPGISQSLAVERAQRLSSLRYALALHVPERRTDPIAGRLRAEFKLGDNSTSLALDFAQPAAALGRVRVNGKAIKARLQNQHLVLPASALIRGENVVDIEFVAGDAALNRNDDYLYSLFVPARASQVMPVFDQPDLKARWRLSLNLPARWTAVSNGAEVKRRQLGHRVIVGFGETAPIPSYLFAFAAGRFAVEALEAGGRHFRMFHREADGAKLARNRDSIARLHADALDWLEKYSEIPYPYPKFDFVLIPSFQFGGMEHPGAIFYKASSLLLDESATQAQILRRASLIAHETAHMWFGDLVTMRWFDDVWMKEVFANFLAAKIVNPAFPDINHDLHFLFQHYPGAYGVDRTEGANPIRQTLANMNEAASLYGAIIYQKAPIVMRQLELLLGDEPLRAGIRDYLKRYAHGNASWSDLIEILATRTTTDLRAWSRTWVEAPGRPRITVGLDSSAGALAVQIRSEDPLARGHVWPQLSELAIGYGDHAERQRLLLAATHRVELDAARGMPTYVLPTGAGLAYGDFILEGDNLSALADALPEMADPLSRGAALITLWESMLQGRFGVDAMTAVLLASLPRESDALNRTEMLAYLPQAFWRLSLPEQRRSRAPAFEAVLRTGLQRASSTRERASWFAALQNIATEPATVDWLYRVWQRQEKIVGLPLSEEDESLLALELAVRDVPQAPAILTTQLTRMQDADRKAKFQFIIPALSSLPAVRQEFFDSLKQTKNRQHEDWVIQAIHYLHHPLRVESSQRLLNDALTLVREIQATGDIFFPKRWADATLGGYHSEEAASAVRHFIATLPPDYPPRLRWVLLASADSLFRAARLTAK